MPWSAAQVDTMVHDETGTLTAGERELVLSAAAMALSSLSVVLSSLRLRRITPR